MSSSASLLNLIVGFVIAVSLASCASISEEECLKGDWFGIGLHDGERGYLLERLERHQKACQRVDVLVDQDAYFKGRFEGLKSYCTPQNAYVLASNGRRYNDVCPPDLAQGFANGLQVGDRVYDARRTVRRLESSISSTGYTIDANARQIDELRDRVAFSNDATEKRSLRDEITRLRSTNCTLRRSIASHERDLRRAERDLDDIEDWARVRMSELTGIPAVEFPIR